MLCKNESRDPAHCLKEGRRVTRCATDLWVILLLKFSFAYINCQIRITKMRENCLQQFDAHWECLEKRNQVCITACRLTSTLESTLRRFACKCDCITHSTVSILNAVSPRSSDYFCTNVSGQLWTP
jgi:hypothetical protein